MIRKWTRYSHFAEHSLNSRRPALNAPVTLYCTASTMEMPDSNAVALKLPVFWIDQPRVWLQQAEAQFALKNITSDVTKYHYVVAALDQTTALRVIDVLEDPPQHGKYDNLRRRLTDVFGLSPRQRADRLLEFGAHSLGDMRPSQLMDEMLGLLGGHRPCLLFESLFLKSMPEDVRMQLTTASFDDPRALAKTADALWQARGQASVVSAADNRSPPTSNNRTQRNARPRATDICYYHRRFGNAARKCKPPCTFTGNDRAGRQ